MSCIAVIGGSGFIGTRLTKRLLDSGHTVRILDKAQSKYYPEMWRLADVRQSATLDEGLTGCDAIFNLAAEHRDDVTPVSLYDEVNVDGARNVCEAAARLNIRRIVFTSSVAVYGFAAPDTDESGAMNPFNNYGRTKMLAEGVYREWLSGDPSRSLTIIRPTVTFGERNRGNVYNLIRQISSRLFVMVGNGRNVKSMAYVENVAALLERALTFGQGEWLYNYIDKPDLSMNELVPLLRSLMGKRASVGLRLPYWIGYAGGLIFDAAARISGKKFPISAIRVKKFCSTTQFSSDKVLASGFRPPVPLREGIERTVRFEFLGGRDAADDHVFVSE